MQITTSSLFSQVGIYFSISHKVTLYIRKKLNEMIVEECSLNEIKAGWSLNLIVSTNSDIQEVIIKGPDISKKYKEMDWGMWLPYSKITGSADPLKAYLYYYFEAVYMVLQQYKVPYELVAKVRLIVEAEVLNNNEYLFFEEEDSVIDWVQ